ncbi:MAG TPA: holo-ACP synthase [bacterium]|nr:holo-ACP synthase [bacterium]
MVLGIGTDLIEVERVRELAAKGDTWLEGVFTPREIAYCRSMHYPDRHFAARFAAKEAFMKALGTGWRNGIRFADIEITRDALGKPALNVSGKAREILENCAAGQVHLHLSLSHLKSLASATVIIETGE